MARLAGQPVVVPRRPLQRGVTLVESMAAVAVLGVVSVTALPGFQGFVAKQQVRAAAQDLATDLLLARSEALKRNARVTVAPLGADWSSGWRVQVGGQDLTRRDPLPATLFQAAPTTIAFNPLGRVDQPTGSVRITLQPLTSAAASTQRCVELDTSGRVRARAGACA